MYTLMIVDDEPLIRESVAHAVGACGLDVRIVHSAANGREALEAALALRPDIVLTDIRMPEMGGIELIRALREADLGAQVVILSGFAEFEYARAAMPYGVAGYVLKPVKGAELRAALDECLRRLPPREDEAGDARRICEAIRARYAEPLRLEELAAEFGFSAKHLSQLVKKEVGKTYSDFLIELRIARAIDLLTHTQLEIKEIAAQVGYDDVQYFTRIFKRRTGVTPGRHRR